MQWLNEICFGSQFNPTRCVVCIEKIAPTPTYTRLTSKPTFDVGWAMNDCNFEECHFFNGLSYKIYTEQQLSFTDVVGVQLIISLNFRTTNRQGLILYFGSREDVLFVAIYLEDSLQIQMKSGGFGCELSLKVSREFDDNQWHSMKLLKMGTYILLTVDDTQYQVMLPDTWSTGCEDFQTDGRIYVGGNPKNSKDDCNFLTQVRVYSILYFLCRYIYISAFKTQ